MYLEDRAVRRCLSREGSGGNMQGQRRCLSREGSGTTGQHAVCWQMRLCKQRAGIAVATKPVQTQGIGGLLASKAVQNIGAQTVS